MYQPNPNNVYVIDSVSFLSSKYMPKGDGFCLPDSGYLLRPDFSLIYDVTKINDGVHTSDGANDAQILVINELLKHFAFNERDWCKIDQLLSNITDWPGNFKFVSSNSIIIMPPPLCLEDCTRKLFGVGTRYFYWRHLFSTDRSICFRAYNAYYPTGQENPIDSNGNIINPIAADLLYFS